MWGQSRSKTATLCANRILVQDGVYDAFTKRLAETPGAMKAIAAFCSADQRCRRSTIVITSTCSIFPVIHTGIPLVISRGVCPIRFIFGPLHEAGFGIPVGMFASLDSKVAFRRELSKVLIERLIERC
jgi:hypothetical protein